MIRDPQSDGLEDLGVAALFVLLLAAVGIVMLILVVPVPAHATECQATHDGKSYWAWRSIDGRRCWYRGHSVMPKSQLHWPEKRRMIDPVFNKIRAEEEKPVALKAVKWYPRPFEQTQPISPPLFYNPHDIPEPECCWPELNEFDRRFTGEP